MTYEIFQPQKGAPPIPLGLHIDVDSRCAVDMVLILPYYSSKEV